MLGLTPVERQFESFRIKETLKQVLVKRPKSIQSLKKSLSINHTHLDDFVKYIKEPPIAFHTSCRNRTEGNQHEVAAEVNGLKNIAKNIEAKRPKSKEIFIRRDSMKCKMLKKELKVQRSDLKFGTEPQSEQNSMAQSNYRFEFLQKKIAGLQNRSSKASKENKQGKRKIDFRNTFSVNIFKYERDQNASKSCKLWRRSDRPQSNHQRWNTEKGDKFADKSLGEITKFCKKKNMKGLKNLVLQLQLNIQDSKRKRNTTGPNL